MPGLVPGNIDELVPGNIDEDVGYSTMGLRAGILWHWHDMVVVPHASAAWQHAFDDVTPEAALAFASTGIGSPSPACRSQKTAH